MICLSFHNDTNHQASESLINSIHSIFAILDFPEYEAMSSFICLKERHNGFRMNS